MYNNNQHLHFVGIGGVGMAGIAEVLLNLGYSVSGSDLRQNALIVHLSTIGASISIGHRAENVPDITTCVIVSSAVCLDNPEVIEAHKRTVPVIPRAEMLAELMRMKYGIAVAGSHGKTTTTSMTGKVLGDIGLDPTVIVGGRVITAQTGAKVGMGQYLIAEADESDGSFCLLRPAIAIVTNIDAEHMSYYGSFGKLEEAFYSFMSSVPFYGLVVACADCSVVMRLCSRLKRRVLTFGLSPTSDISASEIELDGPLSRFILKLPSGEKRCVSLPLSGVHMVSNALASIAVALELGGYVQEAIESLESFPGVSRRTEIICEHEGILVLDDYAHHPTEIKATLTAIKNSWLPYQQRKLGLAKTGRLLVLFQPHRYSRTKELFASFLGCFDDADEVWIGEIYSAGEEPIDGISAQGLCSSMRHRSSHYSAELGDIVGEVVNNLEKGDIVVTVGAGSIGRLASDVAKCLKLREW